MSKIKLTQVCDITTGKLDANAAEENGRYPYFTCAPEPLTINSYAFDEDAILLAGNNAAGNFHCQRYNGKFNAYQRTYVITARDGYDIEYIFYCLKINLELLRKKAQGSQTKFLTMQLLDAFEIDDIPLAEQKRIAYTLSDIDSKIENNKKINAELESMAKTIYDYWFLQFEFPNEEGKPYKSSGGKMVWNEELKREIPEGWEAGNLYDIADFINGLACQKFRPTDDKKLPVVKITEMHDGITDNTEYVREDIPEKNIIDDGDILFSWSATLETMIWTGGKAGLNQHIFKVVPKMEAKYYVFMQLSAYIINFIQMAEARKTTMGHITTEHLKQSRIANPPVNICNSFNKEVEMLYKKIISNDEQNKELASLRDFLLPMLMNGQVGFKDGER